MKREGGGSGLTSKPAALELHGQTELGRASGRNSARLRKPKRWDLTEIAHKCKCKNIFLAMPGNLTGINILSHIH